MEYGLPGEALGEALVSLRRIIDELPFKVRFPVEVRFPMEVPAADDIWLSHSYGRSSAYIAVNQCVGMPYEPYFRAFEQIAAGLGGRPALGQAALARLGDPRPRLPPPRDLGTFRPL